MFQKAFSKDSRVETFYELCPANYFYLFRMIPKGKESGRKSLSPWMTCETCQSILTLKDLEVHNTNCPPNLVTWNHNFIYGGILYSTVETYNLSGIYALIFTIV